MVSELKKLAFVVNAGSGGKLAPLDPFSLQRKGIIPQDFEIDPESAIIPGMFDLKFKQNIKIMLNPFVLVFEESFDDKESQVRIGDIAEKCLPESEYSEIDTHVKSQIEVQKNFQEFISKKLGGWQEYQSVNPSVEIEFLYKMTDKKVTLNIQCPEKENSGASTLILQAQISRKLEKETSYDRIKGIIRNYKEDISLCESMVNNLTEEI